MYKGKCLCGLIQYEVMEIEPGMANCHCSMCRKFHGAAFSTFGEAKKENFRWTSGEELLQTYIASNRTKRRFCRNCGSSLTFQSAGGQDDVVEFSLGTLDTEISQRPDAHIFIAYKADWFAPCDSLPQYSEGRSEQ